MKPGACAARRRGGFPLGPGGARRWRRRAGRQTAGGVTPPGASRNPAPQAVRLRPFITTTQHIRIHPRAPSSVKKVMHPVPAVLPILIPGPLPTVNEAAPLEAPPPPPTSEPPAHAAKRGAPSRHSRRLSELSRQLHSMSALPPLPPSADAPPPFLRGTAAAQWLL